MLYNCEIYYLFAIIYDPATTDIIFIMVNIYPEPWEGELSDHFLTFLINTIYPSLVPYPTILAEVTVFTRGPGEDTYC
jgi:hypothetical protein